MTVILQSISSKDEAYAFVEKLYVTAFPDDERREVREQRIAIDENPLMRCCLIHDSHRPIGFITYWLFGKDLCYIEHFAIDAGLRNKGYGRKTLQALMQQVDCPAVLEVELPESSISRKRIGFYRKLGFRLWENSPYEQPPYSAEKQKVAMMLMAYGNLDEKTAFDSIKKLIYKEVYHHQ